MENILFWIFKISFPWPGNEIRGFFTEHEVEIAYLCFGIIAIVGVIVSNRNRRSKVIIHVN